MRFEKNISHFLVHEDKKRVVSCVALESYGTDLAEIRSLAVDPQLRGRRAGTKLLEFALAEARLERDRSRFRCNACAGILRASGF